MRLALWPRASLARDAGLPVGPPSATEFSLAHNVASRAEVDAVMAQAAAAGACIVKPAQDTFWGGYALLPRPGPASLGSGVESAVGRARVAMRNTCFFTFLLFAASSAFAQQPAWYLFARDDGCVDLTLLIRAEKLPRAPASPEDYARMMRERGEQVVAGCRRAFRRNSPAKSCR